MEPMSISPMSMTLAPSKTKPDAQTESSGAVMPDVPWLTVVWNDPVNLMSYVTYVFSTYFGYPADQAEVLMLRVHNEGRAVVSHGGREQMECDVGAMHNYGLWATMERESQ
jgi:ATP-dependent Clp protease adaptor protein ClpS